MSHKRLGIGTDAVTWSSGKWNEGEWMTIDGVLRKPAIRIESFRIWKVFRIHVDHEGYNSGRRTLWHIVTTCKRISPVLLLLCIPRMEHSVKTNIHRFIILLIICSSICVTSYLKKIIRLSIYFEFTKNWTIRHIPYYWTGHNIRTIYSFKIYISRFNRR